MPAWGRLKDVDAGIVYKLEQPVVTAGRKEANQADILVEGAQANRHATRCSHKSVMRCVCALCVYWQRRVVHVHYLRHLNHDCHIPAVFSGCSTAHNQTWTHRAGQHFCSTVQFELRHCDGKTMARDTSRNGTFLNLDENAGADADAFKTFKQEQKWLSQQHPDPRLKSDDDGQRINHGDQIYFRLSFDRSKFTRFVCIPPSPSRSYRRSHTVWTVSLSDSHSLPPSHPPCLPLCLSLSLPPSRTHTFSLLPAQVCFL